MPKLEKTRSQAPTITAEVPIVGTDGSTVKSTSLGHKWQPGQSGNPNGKPKALLTTTLREIFTPEHARQVAQRIIDKSVSGDLRFIELLYGRLEGKIVERRESGSPGAFDQAIEMVETDALLAMIKEIGRRQAEKPPNETRSQDSPAT